MKQRIQTSGFSIPRTSQRNILWIATLLLCSALPLYAKTYGPFGFSNTTGQVAYDLETTWTVTRGKITSCKVTLGGNATCTAAGSSVIVNWDPNGPGLATGDEVGFTVDGTASSIAFDSGFWTDKNDKNIGLSSLDCYTVPEGLDKGKTYYLAFATKEKYFADKADIAAYNQRVLDSATNSPALKKLIANGTTFKAIVSTEHTDAKANVGTLNEEPIYLCDGKTVVLGNAANLFDTYLDKPVSVDQMGNSIVYTDFNVDNIEAWTGTCGPDDYCEDGTKTHNPLGWPGAIYCTPGLTTDINFRWLDFGSDRCGPQKVKGEQFRLYAISSELKVQ